MQSIENGKLECFPIQTSIVHMDRLTKIYVRIYTYIYTLNMYVILCHVSVDMHICVYAADIS